MPIHRRAEELDFALEDLAPLPLPTDVLVADPSEFDVLVALNPHMLDERGELKRVDRQRARRQWTALKDELARLGLRVHVLPAMEGQPDLVFCANPCLPLPAGVAGPERTFVPGRMATAERAPEVAHVRGFLSGLGLAARELEGPSERMEGTGDGLWHPGRRLLWGGIGPRSDAAAWTEIAERFDLEVAGLALVDPDFYHLDTALALLDEHTALVVTSAFDAEGLALIRALVPRVLPCPEDEARRFLAANAVAPDGRHVLIEAQCAATIELLRVAGYTPVPVETDEFLKSGGSAFCMKLLF